MSEHNSASSAPAHLVASIVLYRPDPGQLTRTLETLGTAIAAARSREIATATIILTDHSPTPLPSLPQAACPLQYHHDPANPGFGAGHNAAFRRAVGADFFLVANPDLEFVPDSIAAGIAFLRAHPTVGLVAPALIEADGGLRPACFRHPDLLTLALRARGLTAQHSRRIARYECRDWDVRQPMFDPPLMSGCCLLFRASAYRELGGFGPRYFLYFEDFDLTLRANQLGLSAYCPAMRVAHAGGGASRKGFRHQMHFLRSAWRFFATHGWHGW